MLTELRKQSSLLTELRRVDQHQDATGHTDGSYSEVCEQSELLLRRRLEPTSAPAETFGSARALEQHLDTTEQHLDTMGEE